MFHHFHQQARPLGVFLTFFLFSFPIVIFSQINLDVDGNAKISSLSGTGTRMVVVDAAGNLAAQPMVGGDTDEQTLTLSGNSLLLSAGVSGGGGSVSLLPYLNTDNQTLSFNSGTNFLSISSGNSVDLSSLAGGGGGSGLWSQNGTKIYYNTGYVGIGTNNPLYKLGVYNAITPSGSGVIYGGYTGTGSVDAIGVQGYSRPIDFYGVGVEGEGGYIGVRGEVNGTGTNGYYGVYGSASGTGGTKYGVYGYASGGGTNYAGYFSGDARVSGDLYVNDDILSLDGYVGSTTAFGLYDLNAKDEIGLYNTSNALKIYLQGGSSGFLRTNGPNGNGNNYLTTSGAGSDYGALAVGNTAGTIRAYMQVLSGGQGYMETDGANGNNNIILTNISGYDNNGYVAVVDAGGVIEAGMYVNSAGNGQLFADVKNFRMEHPEDPTKHIWYACIEGPEAAAYDRGTSTLTNGEAFVAFSDHYRLVANPTTMTVSLSSGHWDTYGLCVTEKTAEGFRVKELKGGTGSFSFDWEVKCVRKGYENYRVIRDADEDLPLISAQGPKTEVDIIRDGTDDEPEETVPPHILDQQKKNNNN